MSKFNPKNFQQKLMKVPELKSQEEFRSKQKNFGLLVVEKKLLSKIHNKTLNKYAKKDTTG